jgi:hypothetical protein
MSQVYQKLGMRLVLYMMLYFARNFLIPCIIVGLQLFGFAYGGPFGHFWHKVLDYIFRGKKDTRTVAKKV